MALTRIDGASFGTRSSFKMNCSGTDPVLNSRRSLGFRSTRRSRLRRGESRFWTKRLPFEDSLDLGIFPKKSSLIFGSLSFGISSTSSSLLHRSLTSTRLGLEASSLTAHDGFNSLELMLTLVAPLRRSRRNSSQTRLKHPQVHVRDSS